MRTLKRVLAALALAAVHMVMASPASAQGCIWLRQTCPMFGTTGSGNPEPGTWNITFTGRSSTADKHYNGTERQIQRETKQTYVVNRQNSLTATLSYQLTNRVSLNASVPWVEARGEFPRRAPAVLPAAVRQAAPIMTDDAAAHGSAASRPEAKRGEKEKEK